MATRFRPPLDRLVVTKRSGKREPYRPQKLRSALERVGVPRADRERVVHDVEGVLADEIESSLIDRVVARSLRRSPLPCAARWNLRRALAELGPSGFPFEHFVAELFAAEGFATQVGVRLRGRLIEHEIDVVADRGAERSLCECKLLTRKDGKLDAKTAMYVFGRAVDLDALRGRTRFWLVTNGRFSQDALRFGLGMRLHLLGWDVPDGDSLRVRIERAGLMPLSALATLPGHAKQALLAGGHVLCRDLVATPSLLDGLDLSRNAADRALAEAQAAVGCFEND
ncbi:MAG: restriction endonuclease [Planctomycetes bacterium]|nr:restriction endonuclease [Planctomycetota bacterium]